MEIITLSIAAMALVKPFLEKTAEGVARKIGEDIWSMIKQPFSKQENSQLESFAILQPEEFKKQLESQLQGNSLFKMELEQAVERAQGSLNGNYQQNITSDKIQKQINIQNNTGDIQM